MTAFEPEAPFPADVEKVNQEIAEFARNTIRLLEEMGFACVVLSLARCVPSKEPGHEEGLFAPAATAVSMRRRIAPAVPHLMGAVREAAALLEKKAAQYAAPSEEPYAGYRMEVPWRDPKESS